MALLAEAPLGSAQAGVGVMGPDGVAPSDSLRGGYTIGSDGQAGVIVPAADEGAAGGVDPCSAAVQRGGGARAIVEPTWSVTRLTDTPGLAEHAPRISGDRLVWYAGDGSSREVFTHDLGTGESTRLTDDAVPDYGIEVGGDWVVWQGYDPGKPDLEVFGGSMSSDQRIRTDDTFDQEWPSIDPPWATWMTWTAESQYPEIYVYNLQTKEWLVSDNDRNDFLPRVDEGQVAWIGWDGHDREVFVLDTETGRYDPITDCDSDDTPADIDAGRVVYIHQYGDVRGGRLVYYELGADQSVAIGENVTGDCRLDGDYVVFATDLDPRTGAAIEHTVFLYDLASGRTTHLGYGLLEGDLPDVSGGRVVFEAVAPGQTQPDVFLAELGAAPPAATATPAPAAGRVP